MKHLIHKIYLESHLPDEQEAKYFQEQIGTVLKEAMDDGLSNWMDQNCPEGQVISIEKLEIELSGFYAENWDAWKDYLIRQLKEKLELALIRREWEEDNNVTIRLKASDDLLNWMYFWQHGHWPWRMSADALPGPLKRNQVKKFFVLIPEKRAALKSLLVNEAAFVRCFLSMDHFSFIEFLSRVEEDKSFNQAVALVSAFATDQQIEVFTKRQIGQSLSLFWILWLTELAQINDQAIQFKKVLLFLLKLQTDTTTYGRAKSANYQLKETDKEKLGKRVAVLENILQQNKAQLPRAYIEAYLKAFDELQKENGSSIKTGEETPIPEKKGAGHKSEGSTESDKRLALDAGVVLLHPFLQALFKEAKACDASMNKLKQPDIAIQILHYLVYGDLSVPIGGDATSKILCGEDRSYIHESYELDKGLQTECDTLLKSVIRHWKILKKTSPEGLRVSFLQRRGSIEPKEDFDLLQVEKQSYDILLEHLPWSYSVIKLPWMTRPLHVKWNNM
jgi:hypothetical protein